MFWIGMAAGVVVGFVFFMACAGYMLRDVSDRSTRMDEESKARHREGMEVHWKLLALHERKTGAIESLADGLVGRPETIPTPEDEDG